MATEPANPDCKTPNEIRTGSVAERIVAIIEVVLAFAIVHVSYRSFKHFTELGRLEGASGLNLSPGATMILFTVVVLLLRRKKFADYGLTLKGWRYHLNLGLVWGVLPVIVAAVVLAATDLPMDPLHGPTPTLALLGTGGYLVFTCLLLVMLRRERSLLRRVPPLTSLLLLVGLLSVPAVVALWFHRSALNMLLMALWMFVGAGFGEEIFFRGYVQSRVNEAFGRPFRFLGTDFGVGLFVAALLFGVIHVLNPVDYFAGHWDFAWSWGVVEFTVGLFFGCLRERTGSVFPGAIVHGVDDVLKTIPLAMR